MCIKNPSDQTCSIKPVIPSPSVMAAQPVGFRLTGGGHRGNTLKAHRRHHDMYCHASLGAAVLAFCVNSRWFIFKVEMLRSV